MANVYLALQHGLEREVALKILSPALVEQPGFVERFEHEAYTLSRLDCPNILPVFDYSTVGAVTFLVMPYVAGGSLRSRLDEGSLDHDQMGRLLSEIGEALHYAHEAGIVHRDVKPSNILIHGDGRAVLADFGLARNDATPAAFTAHGFTLGTPGYMPPEQAMGGAVDRRADVYSLGVLAFEMVTGAMPHRGQTAMEIMVSTVRDPVPSARDVDPSLPEAFDLVLRRAMAKDPGDRYPTARDFMAALSHVWFSPDRRPRRGQGGSSNRPTEALAAFWEDGRTDEAWQGAGHFAHEEGHPTPPAPRLWRRLLVGRWPALGSVALVGATAVLGWLGALNGAQAAILLAVAAGFLAGVAVRQPERRSQAGARVSAPPSTAGPRGGLVSNGSAPPVAARSQGDAFAPPLAGARTTTKVLRPPWN